MFKDFLRKHVSTPARTSFLALGACILIKLIAVAIPPFADFFNRYIASVSRSVLAHTTNIFPFSVAEAIFLAAIPFALIYIIHCLVNRKKLTRRIFNLLGTLCALLSLFLINFSIAYDCTPIEDKLDMKTGELTVSDVYEASQIVLGEIKELEPFVSRNESGEALSPFTYDKLNSKLIDEYKKMARQYSFISPLAVGTKRIALSLPMRYTGIVGVYTFFTGEANVNTCQSSYAMCFTAAHEMAHQRGIAPEDEANFVAFLTLYNSDDTFLRYSALMEIFNYMANAVYSEDEDLYYELLANFSEGIFNEYSAEQEFSAEFYDNIAEDVSNAVNDAYLKLQGQAEGTKSYGLVTDLATAYFLNK